MRFPVDNYYKEWKNLAGNQYGQVINANYIHEGLDINDNGGGNSDLGKPICAIASGIISTIHRHTTGFGNHFLLRIEGAWGTRWIHYAHCKDILVTEGQFVSEGQKIATVGNSGTTYAHLHFACIKKLTNIDNVANTKAELDDLWEDPIKFIEKNMGGGVKPVDSNKEKGSGKFDQIVRKLNGLKLIPYDNPERYYDNDDVVNAIQKLFENQGNLETQSKLIKAKELGRQISEL